MRLVRAVDIEGLRGPGIAVIGQDMPVAMFGRGLGPHALAAGQAQRARIAEAPYAAHHAVIVIERTVFLHVDHDVIDIGQSAGAPIRRDRKCAFDKAGISRRYGPATGKPQKLTPVAANHLFFLESIG